MMICPRCGTVYPNNMLYCPGDGTALMRQADGPSSAPVPGSTAPAYWPTPPPKPRRQGGLIALVLGIVLVVVVAAGAWLIVTGRLGDVVTPPMTTHIPTTTTTTAPKPTDWTHGVKQTWQQNIGDATNGWGYGYIPWLLSDQAWVVGDMTSLTGIDPSTGQIMWHLEDAQYGWYLCAHALVGGQLACLEAEQATDNPPWRACLIDPPTGEQQCLDLDGVVSLKPGWSVWWTAITTGDGSVFVQGGTTAEAYADGIWSAALRIDVDPLQVQWVKVFEPGACGPDTSYTAGALDSGDALGVTGNVFWYRGTWQGDVGSSPFALDIRTGQSIFPTDICPAIAPVTEDTFIVPNGDPDGVVTLPGGGQVTFVHAFGGTIAYGAPAMSDGGIVDGDAVRPSVPVYYIPDTTDYSRGILGVLSGDLWDVTIQLQSFIAGAGGTYLNAVVSGYTIVVAGGAGQVVAVDYNTGQVEWSVTVPYEELGDLLTSEQAVFIVGNVVVVTTQGYGPFGQTTILNLATGEQVAQMPGDALVSPDRTMLGIVGASADGSTMTITRYVPVTA